ncbi:hypothetical protein Tco_1357778 [Tanacetum coccineum]
MQAAQDRQKSYADRKRKPVEFEVRDRVMLKVSPWKGAVQFGKWGKLNPRYVRPFKIPSTLSLLNHPVVDILPLCDVVLLDRISHFIEIMIVLIRGLDGSCVVGILDEVSPSPSLREPVIKQLAIKLVDEYGFVIRPSLVGLTSGSVRTDL